MTWVLISRGLWRSGDSRFECWDTELGYWCALDGDRGRVRRFPSEGAAKQWCEQQEGCA